jgi:hypothetical protein
MADQLLKGSIHLNTTCRTRTRSQAGFCQLLAVSGFTAWLVQYLEVILCQECSWRQHWQTV